MEVCTEDAAHSETITTETTENKQGEEEFFDDTTAEFEADAEDGFDVRFQSGRGGFRYVFQMIILIID